MESYEVRLARINSWLRRLLGPGELPPFEINERTIESLERKRAEHEERERQCPIVRRQLEVEIAEFSAEKSRLREILSALELDPARDLSSAHLESLGKVASALGCVDGELVTATMLLSQFTDERTATRRKFGDAAEIGRETVAAIGEARELRIKCEREFSALEGSLNEERKNAEKMRKTAAFCAGKQKEYKKLSADCRADLESANFSEKISHGSVSEHFERIKELEARIKPLRLALDAYQSLPPDVGRARLKVFEKMAEFRQNEDKLQKLLQDIS